MTLRWFHLWADAVGDALYVASMALSALAALGFLGLVAFHAYNHTGEPAPSWWTPVGVVVGVVALVLVVLAEVLAHVRDEAR